MTKNITGLFQRNEGDQAKAAGSVIRLEDPDIDFAESRRFIWNPSLLLP